MALALDWVGIVSVVVITHALIDLILPESRPVNHCFQTSFCVKDVSSPEGSRETELGFDWEVDGLRIALDLNRIKLGLDWEVDDLKAVFDFGGDFFIMGLKDIDAVDSDIFGRVMNLGLLVGVDGRFVTYVLRCQQGM